MGSKTTNISWIFLGTFTVFMAAYTNISAAAAAMNFLQVSKQFPQFVDSRGNWYRFRGVNYNSIMGTTLASPQQEDVDKIASMKFSIIRFPINWNFLEPSPGAINSNYLNQIVSFVHMAENDGVYVIIDMHQWTASQCFNFVSNGIQFGGQGFPGWVVDDLIGSCAQQNNPDGVTEFWTKFWSNPTIPASAAINAGAGNTVWDAYSYAWRVVVWQLRNYPNVLGWDMMNEPEAGSLDWGYVYGSVLPAFYLYIGTRIRWSDWADQYENKNHILFFEGIEGATSSALGKPDLPNIALADHAYLVPPDWASCSDAQELAHMSLNWATFFNLPFILGEFNANSSVRGLTFVSNMSRIVSVNGQSWAWWTYQPKSLGKSSIPYAQLKPNIDTYSGQECP